MNILATLSQAELDRYDANPSDDAWLRKRCGIPDDRYYTVARWPQKVAGQVRINPVVNRVIHAKKISKSDDKQKAATSAAGGGE